MYFSLIPFSDIGLNLTLTVAEVEDSRAPALARLFCVLTRLSDAGSVHPGGSDSGNMTSFTWSEAIASFHPTRDT